MRSSWPFPGGSTVKEYCFKIETSASQLANISNDVLEGIVKFLTVTGPMEDIKVEFHLLPQGA